MADVDFTPLWHWVVRFTYRGSKYFDSPFYNSTGSICFWTEEERDAFIHGEHPEYPLFKVTSVCKEAIPRLKHAGCSPSYYGHNTDEQILGY